MVDVKGKFKPCICLTQLELNTLKKKSVIILIKSES